MTKTVEESAGSVREAAKEKDLSDVCQVVLTSMAPSYGTFDIKVDPGAQVVQALVGVPTTVRASVSGVCALDKDGVQQLFVILQAESRTRPLDWTYTSATEGKPSPCCKNKLGLVWQIVGVEVD